ncbi:MAG: cytochrome c [Neisseriaceae bacterium]|nr:cytochrome c [Neisseriaceae bacterium]
MKKLVLALSTATIFALTACGGEKPVEVNQPAQAEAAPAAEIDHVKARQDAFKKVGENMETIGKVVGGKVAYDAEQFKALVAEMQAAGGEAFQHFGEGTQGGNAKPELWANMDKFEAGRDKMAAAVTALNEAAQTGKLNAIKPKVGDLSNTCKECHQAFKAKPAQ